MTIQPSLPGKKTTQEFNLKFLEFLTNFQETCIEFLKKFYSFKRIFKDI